MGYKNQAVIFVVKAVYQFTIVLIMLPMPSLGQLCDDT